MLEKIIVGERGRGKIHDIIQYAWWNNCNIIVASNYDKDVIKEIIDKQGGYGSWNEWKKENFLDFLEIQLEKMKREGRQRRIDE